MAKRFFYILGALFCLFLNPLYGQYAMTDEEIAIEADKQYGNGNNMDALKLYVPLAKAYPKKKQYRYRAGICYLHKPDEYEKSVQYLESVDPKKSEFPDYDYYMAWSYLLNYRFDESLELLAKAAENKNLSDDLKIDIERLVSNCENGKILVKDPVKGVSIDNIGAPVNTEWSEYSPAISADQSELIFTYRGVRSIGGLQSEYAVPDTMGYYFEDVFISRNENGSWTYPESLGENINTNWHDASISLTPDGQKLLVYRDKKVASGDILISKLIGNSWTQPDRLEGINTVYWEGRGSFTPNERTLYFSSNRPGGYGGKDIYKSDLQSDGSWGEAVNAGTVINTPYDDDAPFFHPDGRTLYFSSKGHTSMGGYDIFRTWLNSDGSFETPVNIGYPINTTGDDVYFVVSADGKKGYYSSGRAGGYGMQDIYTVYPASPENLHVLVMLKGKVTLDGNPVEAKINVFSGSVIESVADYNSNSTTGKYLVNLSVGNTYRVVYELEEFDPIEKRVDATNISEFTEIVIDVPFVTSVVSHVVVPRFDTLNLSDETVYQQVLAVYGDVAVDSLYYRVQVGAYLNSQNFDLSHLKGLGELRKKSLPDDQVMRFSLGNVQTLNEAEALKQKVIDAGNKELPFIIIYYRDETKKLKDLIVAPKGLLYRNKFARG